MKINTDDWKEINLIDFFDMKAGKYYDKFSYNRGNTRYITASDTNNGVSDYIDIAPVFKGNCLTIGKVKCTVFYQEIDFCACADVTVLIPKFKFNKNIGLFLVTVLSLEKNKWDYGRQIRLGDCKQLKISLPVDENGQVDFEFMENYIKSLKHKPIKTSVEKSNLSLNVQNFKEFCIKELFTVKYGVNLELLNCTIVEDDVDDYVNFVARTSENNGVVAKVKKIDDVTPQPAGTITCAGGGSVLSTFVQKEDFYSGRDLYTLTPINEMSIYTKLFCITIIKANKYKFNYGRQANKHLPDLIIKLPVDENGEVDFEFMENYIKALPYSDRILISL